MKWRDTPTYDRKNKASISVDLLTKYLLFKFKVLYLKMINQACRMLADEALIIKEIFDKYHHLNIQSARTIMLAWSSQSIITFPPEKCASMTNDETAG